MKWNLDAKVSCHYYESTSAELVCKKIVLLLLLLQLQLYTVGFAALTVAVVRVHSGALYVLKSKVTASPCCCSCRFVCNCTDVQYCLIPVGKLLPRHAQFAPDACYHCKAGYTFSS
jgi:hypothetical protein